MKTRYLAQVGIVMVFFLFHGCDPQPDAPIPPVGPESILPIDTIETCLTIRLPSHIDRVVETQEQLDTVETWIRTKSGCGDFEFDADLLEGGTVIFFGEEFKGYYDSIVYVLELHENERTYYAKTLIYRKGENEAFDPFIRPHSRAYRYERIDPEYPVVFEVDTVLKAGT